MKRRSRAREEWTGTRAGQWLPGSHSGLPLSYLVVEPKPYLLFSPLLHSCVPLTSAFHCSVENEYNFSDLRSDENY